ncbi:hypothetical protein [Staphylococcus shinii]|uniref:hypothetical protein n=1 Tax=Staphylococcus shinii TaxID=2912228 RepID=UPI003CFAFBC1
MKKKDLKILKITFSGLAAILFFISGLWIVSAFFALLSLYFMDEKRNKILNVILYKTILTTHTVTGWLFLYLSDNND